MAIILERKYYEKIYEGLPESFQDLIVSEDTARKILDYGRKNKLSVEQIMSLATLVGDVLFGLRSLEKFLPDIKEELKLDNERAVTIASQINQNIFLPIKESLRNIYLSTQKEIEPILKKGGEEKSEEVKVVKEIKEAVTKGVREMPSRPTPPPIRPPAGEKPPAVSTPTKPQVPKPPQIPQTPQTPQQPTPKTTELKKSLLEELTK